MECSPRTALYSPEVSGGRASRETAPRILTAMSYPSLIFDPPPALVEKMSQVRFVVMDVDGTITSSGDSTAVAVAQTLGRLDKAGISWSFATGRSIAGLYATASAIFGKRLSRRPPPAICYNGAVTFVPGTPSTESDRRLRDLILSRRADPGSFPFILATSYWANVHFGLRQAILLDSLRYAMEAESEPIREVALAALMQAALLCASGPHFAQPLSRKAWSNTKLLLKSAPENRR